MARIEKTSSNFSGDLFLAFSATNVGALDSAIDATVDAGQRRTLEFLPWGQVDPLHEAVVQAVEEAVGNVLAASTTTVGRDGHRSPGFPVERLPQLMGTA